MAGQSGTPLWKKLGLKPGMRAALIDAPPNYTDLLGSEAPTLNWHPGAVAGMQICHLFVTSQATLSAALPQCLERMARDGMIWVSWPKKASKIKSDVSEDSIRAACLPLGLVDVKVCAVDYSWSGLKLVIRKALR